jgi:hypothetical protein
MKVANITLIAMIHGLMCRSVKRSLRSLTFEV